MKALPDLHGGEKEELNEHCEVSIMLDRHCVEQFLINFPSSDLNAVFNAC